MTPTSPVAGLLTGLLDGAIIAAVVFLVVFVLSHRRRPARVPVPPPGTANARQGEDGRFRRAA